MEKNRKQSAGLKPRKACTLLMLIAGILMAMSSFLWASPQITTNLPYDYYVNASFGSPSIFQSIEYTNTSTANETLVFTLETIANIDGRPLASGYALTPDTSWITASPSSFTLAPGATQSVTITVLVPYDSTYLGKKYEVFWLASGVASSGPSTLLTNNFLLTLDSQAILLNFADETPVTNINMVGNKLIIKAKIVASGNTVTLSYRTKNTTPYTTISAKSTAAVAGESNTNTYTFEIPASAVLEPGLEYFIKSAVGTTSIVYYPSADTANTATFDGTPYNITVTKTTTGTIAAATTSEIIVADGNTEDGVMKLVSPKGAVGTNTPITIVQGDYANTHAAPKMSLSDKPAAVFTFGPSGTKFAKAVALTMLYFDLDNNGKIDSITDTDGNATIDPADLRLFSWDGYNWRMAGVPTINTTEHTVTCSIDHFSEYALFPVTTLTAEDYRPPMKIITPNGDSVNDEADFNSLTEEIKIFDITGRKIRTVSTGKWDGKDDDGSIVESGVYIYQFKVGGTLVSGVIAVAK
jgi:hypothetical protein